jgi:hypothetical protein
MRKSRFLSILNLLNIMLMMSGCHQQPLFKSNSSNDSYDRKKEKEILAYAYKKNQDLKLCDNEVDASVSENNSQVYQVGKQEYIVEILCFLGAYQGNYEYLLYYENWAGRQIMPLKLEVFEAENSKKPTKMRRESISGTPEFNPDTKLLTIVTKYRGLADCGAFAKYQWENQAFKLLEYRIKEPCDGTYLEPEQYSQVYP